MGIGKLRCAVLDVDDLDVAEAFWSEVTGLPVITSKWTGRYSYLGRPDPWKHEVILHLVHTPKGVEVNRAHIDIGVPDVDLAIRQIEAIGGQLKHAPSIFPRPGSYEGVAPTIDWAVMRDPFRNEFCLVSQLTEEESLAVAHAGSGDDTHYRAAAGRTQPKES